MAFLTILLGCLYKVKGIGEDGLGYRYFTGPKRADATKGKFFSGVPLDRRAELASGDSKKYKPILNYQDFSDAFGNCRHEGGVDFGAGKKPIALLRKIIAMATSDAGEDIVLDFFAGSGSTGHAVFEANVESGGNRRFILVQLPEGTGRADFSTISSMTKQRLRNASEKIKKENQSFQGDCGFKVFFLDKSNIALWNPDPENLHQNLLEHHEHILPGRGEIDIIYELLLKLGLDLCVPMESKEIAGKSVEAVGGGVLMLCLAEKIAVKEVEALAAGIVAWHQALAPAGDSTVVFRDSAFADDVAKTNMAAILAQNGLENVRSL